MAQKLVNIKHSLKDSQDWLKNNGGAEWNDTANAYYYSIVFTQDGHLLTHGVDINGSGSVGTATNIAGGGANQIPYQTAEGTTGFITAGSVGEILKMTDKGPAWSTDNNNTYQLSINGKASGDTTSGFNLGSIYAPTEEPKTGLLAYNSGWINYGVLTAYAENSNPSATDIPTAKAVYDFVNTMTNGLTSAMHYKGTAEVTVGADGTITIAGTDWKSGDVVVDSGSSREYVYDGKKWRELGDEGSYALKTIEIKAGDGLNGGGDLTQNRTISLPSITRTNASGTATPLGYKGEFSVLTGIESDKYGRITKVTTTKYTLPSSDEINYSGVLYWAENTDKAFSNPTSDIKNPYLQLIQNDTLKSQVQFAAGTGISVNAKNNALTIANTALQTLTVNYQSSGVNTATKLFEYKPSNTTASTVTFKAGTNVNITNSNGVLTFSSTNTWRNVSAYTTGVDHTQILDTSISTNDLDFGSEFIWTKSTGDDSNAIHLVWAEVDENGITYTV